MSLDVRTLAALLAWASLLQAMALGIQYSFIRERESLRWWTLGAFLTTSGFTLNALRDLSGLGTVATFLNTPLLLAGASLNYAGTRSFFRRNVPWKTLGITLGFFMAAIAWFTFVQDKLLIRRVLLSIVASSLSLLTAKAFWEGQTEALRNSVRFLASVFLAYGIYFLLRGVSALALLAYPSMANATGGLAIVYFVALTCGILWSFGFILLANQRLAVDIQTNEAFLSDVIEHNGALIYAKDLEGRYKLVNRKWEQVTGLSRRQVLGESDRTVFPGEIGRAFRELDEKVLTSGQLVEHEERLEDSSGERWFLSLKFPLRNSRGTIRGICGISSEITDRKRQERQVEELVKQLAVERDYAQANSLIDPLTRLANRRQFDELLSTEFFRLKRSGAALSLIILDVDHFKRFNDRYGHVEGDSCLRRVGHALKTVVGRASDVAARFGGEEFAVVLPETEAAGARTMAERIRRAIEQLAIPHQDNSVGPHVSVSLGVVTRYATELAAPESLIELADQALYRAKQAGRNRVEISVRHPEELHQGPGLVRLVWKDLAESGNELLDNEHKALFEHANNLLSAVVEGRPKVECRELLDSLIAAVVQHFKDEESLIRRSSFPFVEHHVQCHTELVAKAAALSECYDRDELALGELFSFLAYEVIAQHLFHEDRKFFPYL
ncbi:MAG: diguanylate cyclase [Holophagaceae bacterium]